MDRDIAMVFQNYAPYPHMTVRQNMAYGLKIAGIPKNEIAKKVEDAARLLLFTIWIANPGNYLVGNARELLWAEQL